MEKKVSLFICRQNKFSSSKSNKWKILGESMKVGCQAKLIAKKRYGGDKIVVTYTNEQTNHQPNSVELCKKKRLILVVLSLTHRTGGCGNELGNV